MLFSFVRHYLVKTVTSHAVQPPTNIPLIRRIIKRSIHISHTKHLLISGSVKNSKPGTKFSKKIKICLLNKVRAMEDPKILEALAPFQTSVKQQVIQLL